MSLQQDLENRSGNQCELCTSTTNLSIYEVKPTSTGGIDGSLLACETCVDQIENPENTDANHWRCLNDSMWSEFRAVKVIAWRMLSRLHLYELPFHFRLNDLQILSRNANHHLLNTSYLTNLAANLLYANEITFSKQSLCVSRTAPLLCATT